MFMSRRKNARTVAKLARILASLEQPPGGPRPSKLGLRLTLGRAA